MPDENGQQGNGEAGGQAGASGKTPLESLPADIQAYIKELRDEAKNYRESKTTLQQQLDTTKAAQQAELAKQGNFETLARQHEAEVARLKPVEQRAAALEQVIRTSNEARIKGIPDNKKNLVQPLVDVLPPEKLQEYLNANPDLFVKEPAANYDAGAGAGSGGNPNAIKLDADEVAMAKRMGVTPEDYMKVKARKQSQS